MLFKTRSLTILLNLARALRLRYPAVRIFSAIPIVISTKFRSLQCRLLQNYQRAIQEQIDSLIP
jgi:hypothetical protein